MQAIGTNGVHEMQAGVNGVTENFDKETGKHEHSPLNCTKALVEKHPFILTGTMGASVYHDTKEDAASESPKTAPTSPERTTRADNAQNNVGF